MLFSYVEAPRCVNVVRVAPPPVGKGPKTLIGAPLPLALGACGLARVCASPGRRFEIVSVNILSIHR